MRFIHCKKILNNNTETPAKNKSAWGVLALLFLLFTAPGVAAYWFYHQHTFQPALINHGKLFEPAQPIDFISTPKWSLILWNPGRCEQSCQDHLEILARVRLALGRNLYRVEHYLVQNSSAPALPEHLKTRLKDRDIHWTRTNAPNLPTQSALWIADPNHYLILSYPLKAPPEAIFKDLALLLRNSAQ